MLKIYLTVLSDCDSTEHPIFSKSKNLRLWFTKQIQGTSNLDNYRKYLNGKYLQSFDKYICM